MNRRAIAIAVAVLVAPGTLALAADAGAEVHGTTVTAQPAGSLSWPEMLRLDAQRSGQPHAVAAPRPWMPAPKRGEILVGPPAPSSLLGEAHSTGERGTCVGLSMPSISTDFLAIADANYAIPPDTMGAVGPSHVITMLNDRVRIQDRTGSTLSTVFLSTFWSPAAPSGGLSDPTVYYDDLAGRFIAECVTGFGSGNSAVLFAISRTDDPTGTWDFYHLDADSSNFAWADFPRMGYNSTWIAITTNMFQITGAGSYQGVTMWAIDTTSALSMGGALTFTRFDYGFDTAGGASGFSMAPAVTHDAAEATLWIVDCSGYSSGGTALQRVSRITGTGASPAWSVEPGSLFSGTGLFFVGTNFSYTCPNAQQLGTTTRISSNDFRVVDAEFRNGALWYCHVGGLPASSPTRTSSFWYQIDPTNLPTPIIQSGVVDASGVYHIFPSLAVNCANDMMIGFSRSSSSMYIEAAYTYRLAGDATGTTRAVQTLKAGEDSYVKDFGSGSVRWGDYSATVVDPVDDRCMWTIQEYARTDVGNNANDDRWGTWWGSLCESVTLPGAFNLVAPGNGATDVDLGPILQWSTSTDADSYLVELDDNAGLGSPLISQVVSAPTTQLDLPDNTLAGATPYYWRVTAQNTGGDTVSSPSLSSFTTLTPPSPCVGDVNGDGYTDVFDFGTIASNFGQSGFTPYTNGDLNGDGIVNVYDFGIFAADFGCHP